MDALYVNLMYKEWKPLFGIRVKLKVLKVLIIQEILPKSELSLFWNLRM